MLSEILLCRDKAHTAPPCRLHCVVENKEDIGGFGFGLPVQETGNSKLETISIEKSYTKKSWLSVAVYMIVL